MKKKIFGPVWLAAALLIAAACGKEGGGEQEGRIRLRFEQTIQSAIEYGKASGTEIPDTNDFILEITDPSGNVVYSGAYGKAPETVTAPSGSCTVKVRSGKFTAPAFSSPLYGDEQIVSVPSGGVVDVHLTCRLLNCGIRLKIDSGFLTAHPSGVLFVRSADGRLMYSYSEKRIAYFEPGSISVVLSEDGSDRTLMTRELLAREILEVGIGVSSSSSASGAGKGITIQVDTSAVWLSERYIIGQGSDKGSSSSEAKSVSEAKTCIGEEDVWVTGYIVGGDLTSSEEGISFEEPFKARTNIAIAARALVDSKSSCISVQLPSGEIRDALNLVDNPELLGERVTLKGDIVESYFGIVGLKNLTGYVLE